MVGTTNEHKFMLRRVAHELDYADVPAFKAMTLVIRLWPAFTAYADDAYSIYKPPQKPTPEYLARAVRAIPSFYNMHYQRLNKADRENDPKVWGKLLKGFGKKIRKKTEKEYMKKRKTTDGVFESRADWLHRIALAKHAALEQSLSNDWAYPSPDEQCKYERWRKVIKRTSAMLGVHFLP